MNCDRVRQYVVEESGTPDSSVDRHVEGCEPCRDFVRDLGPVRAWLASGVEVPPETVWQRLRPTVATHAGKRLEPWWRGLGRRMLTTAAAAAAVVAVAWHGLSGPPPPQPQVSPPAVARDTLLHESSPARVDPVPSVLAGPGREDADLRGMRTEIDWLQRDMQRF